ncbi:hypothetical protein SRCM100623_02372 [Acetobacter pasteurianus]|uniref:Uncharacterized protein n=1 Tax=Acetobacter pasteurianus TaxID=438 RepID=A0A1A0D171_ACEPA|nr:hypothetical protein SRCM100623_02372 [Acetobacter pasteurianus]
MVEYEALLPPYRHVGRYPDRAIPLNKKMLEGVPS